MGEDMRIFEDAKHTPIKTFVVTGLSGAGKSTALQVFEDLGYFTVDGLPLSLVYEMVIMMRHDSMSHFKGIALGISLHSENLSEDLDTVMPMLALQNVQTQIVFLEADESELLRRYATTRRPHPLESKNMGLESALKAERLKLKYLRHMADLVLDSTTFSIHDLRRTLQQHYGKEGIGQDTLRPMKVHIISFGFKYGVPKEADMIFDVRFLPNPHFDEDLRPLSGKDSAVEAYVYGNNLEQVFFTKFRDFILFTLSLMEAEGRFRLTLAIGCTGGRHRSVVTAERIFKAIQQVGYVTALEHRHMALDPKQ